MHGDGCTGVVIWWVRSEASDNEWIAISEECLQYWYLGGNEAGADEGALTAADEGVSWWRRPFDNK
jgi:hypothetical protein